MAEVLMVKRQGRLVATDQRSADALRHLKDEEVVRVVIRRARNGKHHRKAFALFGLIFDNQSRYPTMDHLMNVIKIGTGHYDEIDVGGRIVAVPRSIDYASMDQEAFSQWWDRVVDLVAREILPGIEGTDLEREIAELIGEQPRRAA